MLDRTIAPEAIIPQKLKYKSPKKSICNNGLTIYSLSSSTFKVFKLELVFKAGYNVGERFADSYFLSRMLTSGTSKMTSAELNERFDQLGGYIECSQNSSRLSLKIYGLQEKFDELVNLLFLILNNKEFNESEFNRHKKLALNGYKVNKKKSSYNASVLFKKTLFGEEHSYGKSLNEDEIMAVTFESCQKFYLENVFEKPFDIFLSGNFNESNFQKINERFSSLSLDAKPGNIDSELPTSQNPKIIKSVDVTQVQSSLKMGKVLFSRCHQDYIPFLVSNMLFGGFFGSRLMKNIREDKGYTYGISSTLISFENTGYLSISSDLKKDTYEETISEIKKEIMLLQAEPVPEEELLLVKNYLSGILAGSISNVFDSLDRFKTILYYKLPENYYESLLSKIDKVTSEDVQNMAVKYLKTDEFSIVVK